MQAELLLTGIDPEETVETFSLNDCYETEFGYLLPFFMRQHNPAIMQQVSSSLPMPPIGGFCWHN